MSDEDPPRLLDLAVQSVLASEALAIASLEWLPSVLFPPLLLAAVDGGHSEVLKAMVLAWPFRRLPLGALGSWPTYLDSLRATLDALETLQAQGARPARCKLQLLDLEPGICSSFSSLCLDGPLGASALPGREPVPGAGTSVPPPGEPQAPGTTAGAEAQGTPAEVEVLADLCFQRASPDPVLRVLLERVRRGKSLPRLRCSKLEFAGAAPKPHLVGEILGRVRLDRVQLVGVYRRWDLRGLNDLVPYLGQMEQVRTLHLSRVILDCRAPSQPHAAERLLARFSAQLGVMRHLRHVLLESVRYLEENLSCLLGCLQSPLETLSITDCKLHRSDLRFLCRCAHTSHLRCLDLSGVSRAGYSHLFLSSLLERASGTLSHVNLTACKIQDAQLGGLRCVLGRCPRLRSLVLCGNVVSARELQALLLHTLPRCAYSVLELPVPADCYVGPDGALDQDALRQCMEALRRCLPGDRPHSMLYGLSPCLKEFDMILIQMEPQGPE